MPVLILAQVWLTRKALATKLAPTVGIYYLRLIAVKIPVESLFSRVSPPALKAKLETTTL
jgi:hypothetical protein